MKTRKIILLSACAVLLFICIIQAVTLNRNTVKVFNISEAPDEISIKNASEVINLKKIDDEWYIGSQRYPANASVVDSFVAAVKSVKALDKVGTAGNEASQNRYDLNEGKGIVVTASANGKLLRTLCVGKASTTGSQGYVTIDDSKDVYLASGNLNSTFNKTLNDVRSKTVWTLEKNMIGAISIKNITEGSQWKLSRSGQSENITWNIDGSGVVVGDVDSEKATSWFNEFSSLTANSWYSDNAKPEGTYLISCQIECGGKTVTTDIYQIQAETEDDGAKYCGTSSETPYVFEVSAYAVKKFLKQTNEILK